MKDWKSEVTLEKLPDANRKLAEVIGVEAMLKLCERYGGESLYIPMTDAIYAAVRREWIRKEYAHHNSNPKWLAKKYGLSEREVQRIVRDIRPDQLYFFD